MNFKSNFEDESTVKIIPRTIIKPDKDIGLLTIFKKKCSINLITSLECKSIMSCVAIDENQLYVRNSELNKRF